MYVSGHIYTRLLIKKQGMRPAVDNAEGLIYYGKKYLAALSLKILARL